MAVKILTDEEFEYEIKDFGKDKEIYDNAAAQIAGAENAAKRLEFVIENVSDYSYQNPSRCKKFLELFTAMTYHAKKIQDEELQIQACRGLAKTARMQSSLREEAMSVLQSQDLEKRIYSTSRLYSKKLESRVSALNWLLDIYENEQEELRSLKEASQFLSDRVQVLLVLVGSDKAMENYLVSKTSEEHKTKMLADVFQRVDTLLSGAYEAGRIDQEPESLVARFDQVKNRIAQQRLFDNQLSEALSTTLDPII